MNNDREFWEELIPVFSDEDKIKLRNSARNSGMQKWRWIHGLQAMAIGGLSGIVPTNNIGVICSLVTIDLAELLILSFNASFGIGHILDNNEVLYGDDILGILSIWTEMAEALSIIPPGKFGLKLSVKALPKVAPTLVSKLSYKAILKTNSKFSAKLASKVAGKVSAKIATKVATKEGVKQVVSDIAPWIGGVTSLGINCWIINDIMDSAEKYYSSPYLILDNELGGLLATT